MFFNGFKVSDFFVKCKMLTIKLLLRGDAEPPGSAPPGSRERPAHDTTSGDGDSFVPPGPGGTSRLSGPLTTKAAAFMCRAANAAPHVRLFNIQKSPAPFVTSLQCQPVDGGGAEDHERYQHPRHFAAVDVAHPGAHAGGYHVGRIEPYEQFDSIVRVGRKGGNEQRKACGGQHHHYHQYLEPQGCRRSIVLHFSSFLQGKL